MRRRRIKPYMPWARTRIRPPFDVSAALRAFHRGDCAAGKRLTRHKDRLVTVGDLITLRALLLKKMSRSHAKTLDLLLSRPTKPHTKRAT